MENKNETKQEWQPSDGAGRKAATPQPERKGDLNVTVGDANSNHFIIKNPG